MDPVAHLIQFWAAVETWWFNMTCAVCNCGLRVPNINLARQVDFYLYDVRIHPVRFQDMCLCPNHSGSDQLASYELAAMARAVSVT